MEKNMDTSQILTEVQHHIDTGIQEITLLGQIVNKYPNFDQLCDDILNLPG